MYVEKPLNYKYWMKQICCPKSAPMWKSTHDWVEIYLSRIALRLWGAR